LAPEKVEPESEDLEVGLDEEITEEETAKLDQSEAGSD
jgi:hypothetical protein